MSGDDPSILRTLDGFDPGEKQRSFVVLEKVMGTVKF
jgi:hypothetical protein